MATKSKPVTVESLEKAVAKLQADFTKTIATIQKKAKEHSDRMSAVAENLKALKKAEKASTKTSSAKKQPTPKKPSK